MTYEDEGVVTFGLSRSVSPSFEIVTVNIFVWGIFFGFFFNLLRLLLHVRLELAALWSTLWAEAPPCQECRYI